MSVIKKKPFISFWCLRACCVRTTVKTVWIILVSKRQMVVIYNVIRLTRVTIAWQVLYSWGQFPFCSIHKRTEGSVHKLLNDPELSFTSLRKYRIFYFFIGLMDWASLKLAALPALLRRLHLWPALREISQSRGFAAVHSAFRNSRSS